MLAGDFLSNITWFNPDFGGVCERPLRISGLIGLTWNISSSVGPAATGLMMQRFGSTAMVSVLWMMALVFFVISVWKVKLPTRVVS